MPYILRDNNDIIVGIAQSPQESWGGEWLPDDHPDVVAYNTPPETFEALARRVLDESASVQMLAQLLPVLPGMLLMAEAGTEKGTQAALLFLSLLPLPAELEDERKLLLQKLGG